MRIRELGSEAAQDEVQLSTKASSAQTRKAREDSVVVLRKGRREEHVRKRRFSQTKVVPRTGAELASLAEARPTTKLRKREHEAPAELLEILAIKQSLGGSPEANEQTWYAGLRTLRKLCCCPAKPPIQHVVASGILARVREALAPSAGPRVQFEATWVLTNVASSTHTKALLEYQVLPCLVPLLQSPDARIREHAAWCFGNVAGDCEGLRDAVLGLDGAVKGITFNLMHPASLAMGRNLTWVVSNLCRGNDPKPDARILRPLVPVLVERLRSSHDPQTVAHACWALSYMSDGAEPADLQPLVVSGACGPLVRLVSDSVEGNACVKPALRSLGNVVAGVEHQTQAALDAGLLAPLVCLLGHPAADVRAEAAWVVSNVAAGSEAQVGQLISTPCLVSALVRAMAVDEWPVRREAALAVTNICAGGSARDLKRLVEEHGAVRPLCELLGCPDVTIIHATLGALEKILRLDIPAFSVKVEECNGLEAIQGLQSHPDAGISDMASDFIDDFFADTDDEDSYVGDDISADMADTSAKPSSSRRSFCFFSESDLVTLQGFD